MRGVDVADLGVLIAAVRRRAEGPPRRLYLVGGTSHVALGWREDVPRFDLAGDPALRDAVYQAADGLGIDVAWDTPADIIPPPAGWELRSRVVDPEIAGRGASLDVRHFDPYTVVLRLIARGDEPDYIAALEYLRHGWVEMSRLEGLIAEMLPFMTSATLAQDPAEFRRKFKGLGQLWASEAARAEAIGFTAATWA